MGVGTQVAPRCALAISMAALTSVAVVGASSAQSTKTSGAYYTEQQLEQLKPGSPNPYLAYLPTSVEPDWAYWRSLKRVRASKLSPAPLPRSARVVTASETEPNNSQATATLIAGLGTGAGEDNIARISGQFAQPLPLGFFNAPPEDNGSIPLAGIVDVLENQTVGASANLGDGPYGSFAKGTGDFDFYRLQNIQKGTLIEVDIDTTVISNLDSFVTLWDIDGNLLAFNDDDPFSDTLTLDSFLSYTVEEAGDYFISVGSFESPFPLNPFDSSSGFGAGSEGPYNIFIAVGAGGRDPDYISFDADAGDIIGVGGDLDATSVALFGPDGALLVSTKGNLGAFIYPATSPLQMAGNAVVAYVAPAAGRYIVRLLGGDTAGTWSAEIRLFRPPLESAAGAQKQILFLDFDGATVDPSLFGGPPGLVALSPLSSFLPGWHLGPNAESDVIDAIVADVRETLDQDMRQKGLAGSFEIEIRNSRDDPDPFGQPNVSRVIVGGTISESGIPTIGIAQSIDPGNFARRETALVLLDLLSASPFNPNSLNAFPRAPGASVVDIVGVGVGNIVAHEAGHFFGNFHTDNLITPPNIMDSGGNLANTVGVGSDGVFGTFDDIDVDFGVDLYDLFEGFSGMEDTLNMIAFALSTGVTVDKNKVYVDLDAATNGTGTLSLPFNRLSDAVAIANPAAEIRIFSSSGAETFSGGNRINKPLTLINQTPGSGKVSVGKP